MDNATYTVAAIHGKMGNVALIRTAPIQMPFGGSGRCCAIMCRFLHFFTQTLGYILYKVYICSMETIIVTENRNNIKRKSYVWELWRDGEKQESNRISKSEFYDYYVNRSDIAINIINNKLQYSLFFEN